MPYISHNGQACGVMMNTDPSILHAIAIDEKYFRFMPGPELNFNYYRGQNAFYELCYPSLYRHDNVDKILNELKKIEFFLLLKEHPVIQDLENLQIQNLYFKTEYEGLAQHYGFKTNHIDVTNDKNIAMFFACTLYRDGKYEVFSEEREVVVYTISALHPGIMDKLNIVGAQAIPRPVEQKAYSIELNKDENFNNLPFVSFKKFMCTVEMSKKYYDMFSGGNSLFPADIVNRKANEIQNSNQVSKTALEIYFEQHNIVEDSEQLDTISKVTNALKNLNIFKNRNSYFNKRESVSIRKKWNDNKDIFFHKIAQPRMSCYI